MPPPIGHFSRNSFYFPKGMGKAFGREGEQRRKGKGREGRAREGRGEKAWIRI